MPKLNEVFGVSNSIPQYTYVDRSGLDKRFAYSLGRSAHIVLHGGSKQGKTVLRRKNLRDEMSVVVQCTATTTCKSVYGTILARLDASVTSGTTDKSTLAGETGGTVGVSSGIPFLTAKVEASAKVATTTESSQTQQRFTFEPDDVHFLADAIKASGRRVIIEDFHYMPEEEKRKFAFDLKAFWDLGVFFIVVGIWAEHNLLAYYNSDLSGRIDEIDVQWSDSELDEVLAKGESALKIIITPEIRVQMISDASQNVGLLQRIAERFCYSAGVLETADAAIGITLSAPENLGEARKSICSEEASRYRQFGQAISRGFKSNEESELKVYLYIARCAMEASDHELRDGIHYDAIFDRVNVMNPRVRRSDLTAALQRLNRLQEDRQVSPLVLSYNEKTRQMQLVDRELLFYRKYGNPSWPWNDPGFDQDAQ
jgi:hypothetical protein